MESKVSVSVIIPVYNVEAYVRECIDSVINQELEDLEIILVNDGSTDSSGSICREYAVKYDSVILIEKENGGLSSARNAGFRRASGKYVYFLDSDDYIAPDCLKSLYDQAETEKLDILFFAAVGFCGGRERQPGAYKKEHIYESGISGKELFVQLRHYGEYVSSVPLYLARREWILSHNLTFAEGYLHEDEIYTFVLLQYAERAGVCNQIFYHRRYRAGSITQSKFHMGRFEGYAYVCSEMIKFYCGQTYTKKQQVSVEKYILEIFKAVVLTETILEPDEKDRYKRSVAELQKKLKKTGCCHQIEGYALCYCLTWYRWYNGLKKCARSGKSKF